jgi:spermidine synthase
MAHRQRTGRARVLRHHVDQGVAELVADAGRARAWTLLLDGTPQSYVDLDDPEYLDFEYVRRLGHLADLAAPPGRPVRVLHLGAGGLTLARYVTATRPRSRQLVAEVDGALVELIRRALPANPPRPRSGRAGRLRIRVGDARQILEQVPAGAFDLVISDVFAGGRTPAHLTSAEFAAAAGRALGEGGMLGVNAADGGTLAHARVQAATVRSVFADVCVIADPAVFRGRRFGNLVLAASHAALPVAALTRRAAADPFPGRVLHGAGLVKFIAGAAAVTDAEARPSPRVPRDVFAGLPGGD